MDQEKRNEQHDGESQSPAPRPMGPWILLIGFLVIAIVTALFLRSGSNQSQISYGYFQKLIEGRDFEGKPILDEDNKPVGNVIEAVKLTDDVMYGTFRVIPPPEPVLNDKGEWVAPKPGTKLKKHFAVRLPSGEQSRALILERLEKAGVKQVDIQPSNDLTGFYLMMFSLLIAAMVLFVFLSMRRAQNQFMGGGGFLSNFSRSPAKRYEPTDQRITFDDVAGLESVKADLQEIVEFLRDPGKFQRLGGRVPKGVLLVGPPGTGKTLLARAIAGEADVPYFSVNGSEFIQMFVGVGASRVRDLFTTAKNQAPAIIFIDEIDAVGRQRGAGLGGGHDEREQTLNQILGEMDGFQANDSVIVLAATNRPDILDPALLRPGRFDRHIVVSRPTLAGREAIFKVHVRNVPLADDVDLHVMAEATAGMTGADIQNLVNEAALWAARQNKNRVEMADFYHAHDKVLMGARREEVLSEKEKERTAYHEAGHTLAAWFLPGASPVHKVTIIPRGQALGITQMLPDEDRMNMSEHELKHNLVMLMAGRAAEQLVYDELTVGAENDLEKATSLARRMVTHWGMNQILGPVSYKMTDEDPFLGREIHQNRHFSEHTMEVIDEEVSRILRDAAQEAKRLLEEKRAELERLKDKLVEKEELDRNEIRELIGPSVHPEKQRDHDTKKAR